MPILSYHYRADANCFRVDGGCRERTPPAELLSSREARYLDVLMPGVHLPKTPTRTPRIDHMDLPIGTIKIVALGF